MQCSKMSAWMRALLLVLAQVLELAANHPEALPLTAQLQEAEQPKECDAFIESNSNEFHSPNYPNPYHDSLDCIKIISAGEGEVIRLRFVEHFHLEPDVECRHDFLEVRDGQFGYSTLIAKLCGTSPPTVLESSGRHLWLRFHSDQDIHYIGFRAFFEFVPSSLARPDLGDCSFHLTHMEANITSFDVTDEILLNRKELSIQNLDCTWIIEAPKSQRIYLQFKAFDLEKANDCTFNFVEVYGSKTELYSKEGRLHLFCGSDTKPIFSKSNVLHLRFFSALSNDNSEIGVAFKTKLHVYYSYYRDLSDFKPPPGTDPGEPEKCNDDEFDCTDNTCIHTDLVCNYMANCKQGNDEDKSKCNLNKAAFQMTMDLIVIAFIGCFLAAGMCSGLILNICRKLRQDKIEMEEIRASLHKSRDSVQRPKSTTNSTHDILTHVQETNSQKPTSSAGPSHPNLISDNSSSVESKDTVIFKPEVHNPEPVPEPSTSEPVKTSTAFGFTFKPMKPQVAATASIPYSPPPPYNPATTTPKPKSRKHVIYDDTVPDEEEENDEVHVIEVRDSCTQTKESFTESYLTYVHFGAPRHYKQSSRSSVSPGIPPQAKRAPLARTEAVECVDFPRKHVRKIPKGPADVLMWSKGPSSIASVDASTGSLELLSELDEETPEYSEL